MNMRKGDAFLVLALCAGLLAAGCGGGGTSNPCEGVQNACPTEGLHRCSGDNAIQTCEKNADGCLVWGAAANCGTLQTCQATGADAACRCNNQCSQAGDSRCKSGTQAIQTCTTDADGCLDWVDGTNCADTDQYCDDSSGSARCATTCTDRCTRGETRCNGDVVEACATAASGCLDWLPGADCAANGQICSDASGTAGCYAPCTDTCDTVDATRCQGEAVQTCRVGNDGCRAWVVTTNCADNSEYCVESGGTASCSATCQDRCPAEGDTRCADDTTVQTCAAVASGCLDWQKTDECSPPRTKCQVADGTAQCVQQCQDVCDPAVDDSQCDGTMRQACRVVASTGCYDWVDLEDCATNGGFCDNSVDPVACADHCTNECDTIDATRCDPLGQVIQVCAAGTDGCNDWVTDTDCRASSQVCYGGSGEPKCVDPCTSECSTPGASRCNADNSAVETCETNTNNGCNYWNVTTTCAEPTPVCDDSGAEAACVCTDQCDSEGATQCSGSVIQVCAQDGDSDSCLEWKDTTDCTDANPTDTCDASSGTAQCVCTDECSLGDTACNGNTLQTCVSDGDSDTCLELADTTDCTQGGTSTDVCATDANGDASCVCSDECPAEGNTRCDANFAWIQTCVTDADNDSCLEWQDTTDCTQGGTSTDVCDASGGAAQCVSSCTDDCTNVGDTQCGMNGSDPAVQECQLGGDGCKHWVVTTTCTGDTPACDDSSQSAQCICVDECTTLGGTCNGNVPENCVAGTDGCNDYIVGTDCGTDVCVIDGGGSAVCVPPCATVVDQQIELTSPDGRPAQDFETASDAYDAYLADDIVLASDTEINMIYVPGVIRSAPVTSTLANANTLNFAFFADNSGVPAGVPGVDQPVALVSVAPTDSQVAILDGFGDGTDGSVYLMLDQPINLPAGTYWFAFWPQMDFTVGGQFFWMAASSANGGIAQFVNPGDGFETGATTWTDIQTAFSSAAHDLAFTLFTGPQCCHDRCDTEGATMCQGADIWTCTAQGNGCLDWNMTSTCTDPNTFCDDSSGSAQCVPPITCTNDIGSATGTPAAQGDNTAETDDFQGSCASGSGGRDVCFTWTAPTTGPYIFDTENSTELTDTVLMIYQDITELACDDDGGDNPPFSSRIVMSVTQGEQYVIVVDGYDASSAGAFDLNINPVPPETTCDDFADNDYDDLPDCADPTDCQTLAVCTPGSGAAGSPCTANSDCSATANDPACLTDAMGFGNGYCSEWCLPGSDDCPAGSLCMDVGLPGIGLCYDACDPAAPDCRTDTWTDPSGATCSYVCNDLGGGQGVCAPRCAYQLTVDGGWMVDTHTSGDDTSLFVFSGTPGTTYYVWWNDAYDGDNTYGGDIEVTAYHEDMSTTYFDHEDSGYTTSQPVTIVAGETNVYLLTNPWSGLDSAAGQYAIAVTSTDVRP